MSACAHMGPHEFCASCAGEKLVAAFEENERLRVEIEEGRADYWRDRYTAVSIAMGDREPEWGWRSTHDLPERVAALRAEVERLRRVLHETELVRNERWERAKQAEARLAKVVEALRVAREYVKATEGQLVTRPNIVTKDRELCDAALAAARPEHDASCITQTEPTYCCDCSLNSDAAQPEEKSR